MPEPADYLTSLQKKGVRLWIADGELRYHAKKGVLDAEDLARLRIMKEDIVAGLTQLPEGTVQIEGSQLPDGSMPAPLSFQQEWLLSLIEKYGNWQPAQAFAFHLTGFLKPEVLERCVDAILRSHDALRSRVVSSGGRHWLETEAPSNYHLDIVSIPSGFAVEESRNLRFHSADLVMRCADPAIGPLTYVRLLRLSDEEHYLILVVHRLVADCTAIGQVFRELWLQYGEELAGQASQPPTQTGQYRDYTTWQQSGDGQWQHRHGAFWREHLHEAARIQWPANGSISCGDPGLRVLQGSLGVGLSARLRELGRQTQSLSALVMLTIFVSVVSRWCGQRDFVVPFNVAGRHAAHESVVGCFSHVLFLRMRLAGDETFSALLRIVSGEFYKAVLHQDLGRMALGHPALLGGAFCQWLSWHPGELAAPETYEVPRKLGIAARPVHFQTAHDFANVPAGVTDLDVTFFESEGDIGVLLIFRPEVWCETALERLIHELRAATERIVNEPSSGPLAFDN